MSVTLNQHSSLQTVFHWHSAIIQWDILLQSRQTPGTNFTSSSFSWLKYSAAAESAMYEERGEDPENDKCKQRRQVEGKWGHTKVNYSFSSQSNSWNLLNATELMIYNLVWRSKGGFFPSGPATAMCPNNKCEPQTLWPQPDTKQIKFCYGALTSPSPSGPHQQNQFWEDSRGALLEMDS